MSLSLSNVLNSLSYIYVLNDFNSECNDVENIYFFFLNMLNLKIEIKFIVMDDYVDEIIGLKDIVLVYVLLYVDRGILFYMLVIISCELYSLR